MALLSSNYKGYLQKVVNGSLELPAYDLNPDGTIKIYYGEVFCRVEDCSRAQHHYSATNNLVLHIKSHEGIHLQEGQKGGRVAQKVVDAAVKWYKGLMLGAEAEVPSAIGSRSEAEDEGHEDEGHEDEEHEDEEHEDEEHEDEEEGAKEGTDGEEALERPPLPMKKNRSVHVTDMRKQVVLMGHKIPCSACGNRNNCCKDMESCEYFHLFQHDTD